MSVTRADELNERPADNAKELLAHDKRALGIIRLATEQAEDLRSLRRLSARQQASVEEVAQTLDPSAFVDLGPGFKRAQKIEMELVTLKASALLAKYDIFEKVSRP